MAKKNTNTNQKTRPNNNKRKRTVVRVENNKKKNKNTSLYNVGILTSILMTVMVAIAISFFNDNLRTIPWMSLFSSSLLSLSPLSPPPQNQDPIITKQQQQQQQQGKQIQGQDDDDDEAMEQSHPIYSLQYSANRDTRDSWKSFDHHRRRVTDLLTDLSRKQQQVQQQQQQHASAAVDSTTTTTTTTPVSAVLFGSGNLNDVDLRQLLVGDINNNNNDSTAKSGIYHQLTFVDLDEQAVRQGINRQLQSWKDDDDDINLMYRSRMTIAPSLDLTNILDRTQDWDPERGGPPSREAYEIVLQAATNPPYLPFALRQNFHVSVSLCLLSQFSSSLPKILPDVSTNNNLSETQQYQFMYLMMAIRNRHISQLIESLYPGGYGLLVIDFVSNGSLSALTTTQINDNDQLLYLTEQAEAEHNYFHGCKREAIRQALLRYPEIDHTTIQWISPWKWNLIHNRQYLVYAVQFQKR